MNSSLLPRDLSGRIPELDGLRGIAIGMVLVYHFFLIPVVQRPGTPLAYALVPGRLAWSGVDLFFVLSGFLIGGILLDAKRSTNYFQVFYLRRFFRIVPAYLVLLGIVFLITRMVGIGAAPRFAWMVEGKSAPLPWISQLLFLQNFWMAVSNSMGAVGVTWSLAVEEQFYVTLPLLIRVLSPRQLVRTAVLVIVSAPILRSVLIWFWPDYGWSRLVLMPCRADALMLGVLGAIMLRDPDWLARLTNNRSAFRFVLLVLSLGCAVLTLVCPGGLSTGMQTVGYTWLAMFYDCVLLYVLTNRSGWIGWFLRWSWLGWLGAIAYGTYLFHWYIMETVYMIFRGHEAKILSLLDLRVTLISVIATLVICWLSWVCFEKPLVRLGHRTRYKFAAEPQAASGQLGLEAASK